MAWYGTSCEMMMMWWCHIRSERSNSRTMHASQWGLDNTVEAYRSKCCFNSVGGDLSSWNFGCNEAMLIDLTEAGAADPFDPFPVSSSTPLMDSLPTALWDMCCCCMMMFTICWASTRLCFSARATAAPGTTTTAAEWADELTAYGRSAAPTGSRGCNESV